MRRISVCVAAVALRGRAWIEIGSQTASTIFVASRPPREGVD